MIRDYIYPRRLLLISLFLGACSSGSEETAPRPTLTLSAPTTILVRDETAQISATVSGGNASSVVYTSSNPAVLIVSATGLATAVVPGAAKVIASLGHATAEMTFTVAEGGVVGPSGGVVTALAGQVEIIIPSGALSAPVAFRVTLGGGPLADPTSVMGSIVTVQPSVSFSPNATLKLRFSDAGMPRGLPRGGVGLRRATSQNWNDISGSNAMLENLVQGPIITTGTYGAGRMRPLQACSAPADRAFDFWVGSWTVTAGAVQQTVATSDITLEVGGCAVFEHYIPLGNAPVGRSVTFRGADGQWHQTYMDDSGSRLLISGSSPAPGVMSLDTTPGATTFERWLWTRNADGSVRQTARVTANGGATFAAPSWDGLYTRRQ